MIKKTETWITPLNQPRTLHLYIPDSLKPGQRVPALYMFDGHNLFEDEEATYGKSWGLKTYLDRLQLPLIVIGIECNHEGNRRLWEFSPYDFSDPVWGEVHGQGGLMLNWMSTELKAWADDHLPVLPDRKHTFIAGSSMGGLMALYAGARYSPVYSRAACLSPYLGLVMEPLSTDLKEARIAEDTRFYISWGGQEAQDQQGLAAVTADNLTVQRYLADKASVLLHCYPQGEHCEACWEEETPVWMAELDILQRCFKEEG